MSGPEDNPADARQSFPCEHCDGDVMEINGNWECNKCGRTPGGEEENPEVEVRSDQEKYDTWGTDKMICPYCGHVVDDTEYHANPDSTGICDNDECGKEFGLEIEYSARYYTKKQEVDE
jgi:ribosomal protein L37AE/L43A